MKTVVQRVLKAQVSVEGKVISRIGKGLLLLVGVGKDDTKEDVKYLAGKIANLRIFGDDAGKTNLNIKQTGEEILSVPQFTLFANTKKGNRPSFGDAAASETAAELWEELNAGLRNENIPVQEGRFGSHMLVELVNDGPVTLLIDTQSGGGRRNEKLSFLQNCKRRGRK
jgi:D-tyrosyl-tRNA(Tyr) deacylase